MVGHNPGDLEAIEVFAAVPFVECAVTHSGSFSPQEHMNLYIGAGPDSEGIYRVAQLLAKYCAEWLTLRTKAGMHLSRQRFGEAFEVQLFNFDQTHARCGCETFRTCRYFRQDAERSVYGDLFEA
jgi:hypothetical protein